MIAIGDVQGCAACLRQLLERLPSDEPLWFAGDLVNRGPASLETLRMVRALGPRATCVLGNHDLHLLAVHAGIRPAHDTDTLDEILAAPDRTELIDWIRRRPLAVGADGYLMVHAGVFPQWSVDDVLARAAEVERVLAGRHWIDFLREMYGNTPARWDDSLAGADRLRTIINALTRMRLLAPDGSQDFDHKGSPATAPAGYLPWFDWPGRRTADTTMVFGHWSALGLVERPGLLALDTGCVWGGELTAIRLRDRDRTQVACRPAQCPGTG
ncbi:MAG: symmetrical bis(5'-nucleosyl)-tetraphosphatase [Burkholderiaceae bacterium]